jgi:VWFA-related protein
MGRRCKCKGISRALLLLCATVAGAQTRLAVTVVDKFGAPIPDLKAEDFTVQDNRGPRAVLSAAWKEQPVDVVLLVDTSAYAGQGRREIERATLMFIQQLGEKEQMAVVSFATSADLMQDLTGSRQLLGRSLAGFRYGNDSLPLDGAWAALDSAFEHAVARRILVIVATGAEGAGKVKRSEVIDLAIRRNVSIFAVSVSGGTDSLDDLARETAGAYIGGREVRQIDTVAKNLFAAMRGRYELSVEGEGFAGKLRVEARAKEKVQVTHRALR